MKLLMQQKRAMTECQPKAFNPREDATTIWDFDVRYTAPAAGYKDVEEYYKKCSSGQFLKFIKTPTTILCAQDDPFIPPRVFEEVKMSFHVNYLAPDGGGHMGYITKTKTPLGDRRWMDFVAVKWAKELGS